MRLLSLASAGWRRVSNTVAEEVYLRSGVDWTRPAVIQGTVNERCNYRCRYCGFWRRETFEGGYYYDEMSIDQWRAALGSLKGLLGRYLIGFVGGEPFLKDGFVDLLEHCRSEGIDWSVCTNGSALARRATAERVVRARPFHIDLSVDSPDPEVNDHLRGVPGALAHVERAIEHLREARERTGWTFPIRIKPVVTRMNYRQLPDLLDWTRRVGADSLDPSPVRPWTGEVQEELWIRNPEEQADLARVVEELVRRKQAGAALETSTEKLRGFVDHFQGRTVTHGALPCRVGMRDYLIRPDGNVKVCWFYPPIGNVKEHSAREIWRGPVARELRRQTTRCQYFGTVQCANSCLAHRTVRQELERGLVVLKSTFRSAKKAA